MVCSEILTLDTKRDKFNPPQNFLFLNALCNIQDILSLTYKIESKLCYVLLSSQDKFMREFNDLNIGKNAQRRIPHAFGQECILKINLFL